MIKFKSFFRFIKNKITGSNIKIKVLVLLLIFMLLFIFVLFFTKFNDYKVTSRYSIDSVESGMTEIYKNRLIRYNSDSVYFTDFKGNIKWSYSYNITSPILIKNLKYFVISEKNGAVVYLFNKDGYVCDYITENPIKSISLSDNGDVIVIVNNAIDYSILEYDNKAELKIKIKIDVAKQGYPIALACNSDASRLIVSFINTDKISYTKVCGFDLTGKSDSEIFSLKIDNAIAPTIDVIDNNKFVVYSTNKILFIRSSDFKVLRSVDVEYKIKSIKTSKNRAVVIVNDNTGKYNVNIFNSKGRRIKTKTINSDYSTVEVIDNQILLYNENKLTIISMGGRLIYEGDLKEIPIKIYKLNGIYRYMIVTNDEILEVKLNK